MMTAIHAPHTKPVDDVLSHFKVSLEKGLTRNQVAANQEKFGKNELQKEPGKSVWELLLEQFDDLLVKILLGAAVVSTLIAYLDAGDHEGIFAYIEPLVILLILIANAIVGVWQESNAEAALEALKDLQAEHAHTLRNGKWDTIEAIELVPGDIVQVRVGDRSPADMRLAELKTTTIRLEQSQLTGESESVEKLIEVVGDKDTEIQGRTNMLFSSTTIANGSGICCVTATGMASEIGAIQAAVQEAGEEEEQTPLAQKIDEFGEMLAKVIFIICAIVWVINYKHFFDPVHGSALKGCVYYFKIAVALAVAAIPEGLPAVITTCLALGTRKMAARNCIVRKLPSVETLGCTTVICSDKTGTLTTNEMTVTKVITCVKDGVESHDVEGVSYNTVGTVSGMGPLTAKEKNFHDLCRVACLCNESKVEITEGKFKRFGEPTEAACAVLVEKLGCPEESLNKKFFQKGVERGDGNGQAFKKYWGEDSERRALLEFCRDRKSMSVIQKLSGEKDNSLLCKGAPESILERCGSYMLPDGSTATLSPDMKKKIMTSIEGCAKAALRTLAFAIKKKLGPLADYNGSHHKAHKLLTDFSGFAKIESEMTWVGLVGIRDPPRKECESAIKECRQAGIAVVMITGDNKLTAEAISEELGIIHKGGPSLTGKEFEALSEAKKREFLDGIYGAVFSRTEPKHKQLIVKILKELGQVVAMTGDGVNDAPALKQADIGIAMGISGTEVAKEASDMVLTDDNFSTIVAAVEEGRSIYNNMKAFIRYLISSNIGEVASIFFTAAIGIPEGLAPVQLLWVNLVTDGLPATALGFNPPDLNVMRKTPRGREESLISGWVFFRYMVIGVYVGFATVGIFVWWYCFDTEAPDGHSLISVSQLMDWGKCATEWNGLNLRGVTDVAGETVDGCDFFTTGKIKASTLSLTVLVVIEMLNAFNALSEDGSLLSMPPWANPWLILACMLSMVTHFMILYIPICNQIFGVVPLTWHDWTWVMIFSSPVIFLDEVLKFCGRTFVHPPNAVEVVDVDRKKKQ